MYARTTAPASRLLATWILLLAAAQLADVVTTAVDMNHGGIEANHFVALVLSIGGIGLLVTLKLLLVGAMGAACLVLRRYAGGHPTVQARAAHTFVWRALQLSVLGLVLVAAQNTALLVLIS